MSTERNRDQPEPDPITALASSATTEPVLLAAFAVAASALATVMSERADAADVAVTMATDAVDEATAAASRAHTMLMNALAAESEAAALTLRTTVPAGELRLRLAREALDLVTTAAEVAAAGLSVGALNDPDIMSGHISAVLEARTELADSRIALHEAELADARADRGGENAT